MKSFAVALPIALLTTALPLGAEASSIDAWEEFRTNVAVACRLALELPYDAPILIEPFGSEHYGFAVSEGEDGPLVCVYDKQSGETEIGIQFEERD